jgi:hypothetical protein
MVKKNASKTLMNGSVKQRLKILDDERAAGFYQQELSLSEQEMDEIIGSFKTSREIELYNLHLAAFRVYRDLFTGLDGAESKYREAIAYITGFTMLWDTYQRNEEMLNSVLVTIEDKPTRAKLVKEAVSKRRYLYTSVEADKEGFIHFYTDKTKSQKSGEKKDGDAYSVENLLQIWKERAIDHIQHIKTGAKAMMDYMKEIDYHPKAFKEKINDLLETVDADRAILPKYSKRQMLKADIFDWDKKQEMYSKYFVYPNPEEIEINEKEYKIFWDLLKSATKPNE